MNRNIAWPLEESPDAISRTIRNMQKYVRERTQELYSKKAFDVHSPLIIQIPPKLYIDFDFINDFEVTVSITEGVISRSLYKCYVDPQAINGKLKYTSIEFQCFSKDGQITELTCLNNFYDVLKRLYQKYIDKTITDDDSIITEIHRME